MATIDDLIKNQKEAEAILLLKRFLDDYFTLFEGSTKDLHAFFVKFNKLHTTIKFTMSHTSIRNEPKEKNATVKKSLKFCFWMFHAQSKMVK